MKKIIVIGVIALFIIVCFQPAFANIMENNPPYEPRNPIPLDGATNVSGGSVLWTGDDPDGDTVTYDIYHDDDSPPKQVGWNQSETFYPCDDCEWNTTYYWKIVAWDEYGASTPGPIWTFTTRGNSPPTKPILVDYGNETIYFYSIDPDGDEIRYHIDWGDGTTETTIWYPSGEIVGMSYSWLEGVYTIGIKAEDLYGAESAWAVFIIKIGNQAPSPPMINGPQNGIVGEEYAFTFNAVDPDGDNVSLFVEWGDGTSDGWSFYVESGLDKIYEHTWFEQDDFFIRCQAMDDYGKVSDWKYFIIVISMDKACNFNLLDHEVSKSIISDDNTPPNIEFVNPREGYFHIYGVPLLKNIFNFFANTVNIGGFRLRPIQVKSNFEDPDNHSFRILLKINNEDKGYGTWNSETECFEWYWTGWAIGEYNLRLRAVDEHGVEYWAYMSVWNLCFFL